MIIKIFASIGLIVTFILVAGLFGAILGFIDDAINEHKYKKQLKSRFKGGTTAKCFCRDCRYYHEKINNNDYGPNVGECAAHNWWCVRDNCYCWDATPLDYDKAKRREEIEKER